MIHPAMRPNATPAMPYAIVDGGGELAGRINLLGIERQIGVYVGTRGENLRACLEIVAEQIETVAAGDVSEEELARAKENLKGRIMLSMELPSASRQMSIPPRSTSCSSSIGSTPRGVSSRQSGPPNS